MANFLLKKNEKLGKAPGTLQFIGQKRIEKVRLDLVRYHSEEVETFDDIALERLESLIRPDRVNWVIVQGLQDLELIIRLGKLFSLHELLLEDVLDTTQHPKYEEFGEKIFLIARRIRYHKDEDPSLKEEQLSLVIGDHFVLVFLESSADILKAIRQRLELPSSRLRGRGTVYLGYAILDRLVDNYVRILGEIGERIEVMEDTLLEHTDRHDLELINDRKREVNAMRKYTHPLIEVNQLFSKTEVPFRDEDMRPFFRDLKDHLTQTLDSIQAFKEQLENQMSTYHAIVANRLNDIIMVLTLFSVVFIPMTFLAGVYGMNFEYLPELEYRYAYPLFWLVQLLIAGGMIYYFRRRGWF